MKSSLKLLVACLLAAGALADANAVTCAKGVYRAGCAGPNGAAVVRKPVAAPAAVVVAPRPVAVAPRPVVVAPAPRCSWVNGVKVCR